ncbi:UNVERIFIED_ORG: hypothetical protein EC838_2905 [Providencia alcalifaciens]|uniref:Uncharacterized protein n=1 Tax=Providencia rettgeri TaxID=587 RepID=A0A379FN02_PRORE|nr:Uncharacterised protein [Providencia rettgeri]
MFGGKNNFIESTSINKLNFQSLEEASKNWVPLFSVANTIWSQRFERHVF